jgi:hypothetical protein
MEKFIHSIYVDIEKKDFHQAKDKINYLEKITSVNHPDVIMANMELKRRMKSCCI